MKNFLLLGLSLLLCVGLSAQTDLFTPASLKTADLANFEMRATPAEASHFTLANPAAMATLLAKAPTENSFTTGEELLLVLPAPSGKKTTFRVTRYQMITEELQAVYPSFVTAYGWDVEAPHRKVFLEWTETGFGASITGGDEGRWFVEPTFRQRTDIYQSFYTRDCPSSQQDATCGFVPSPEFQAEMDAFHPSGKAVGDCELREYDLALACTGEYFMTVGNTQALAVAEMIRAVNRVNEVFRADLAITLKLINLPDDNNVVQLVFSNPATDPYSNDDGGAMLNENQTTIDNVIGSANYDIGHVFSTGGGGVASLESPCSNGVKARGVTGLPNPVGDPFYIDFVAHEMGHQFGGRHTFNSTESNCAERSSTTAYEPGGGTTIQAYAGICGATANIQQNSDPYYHALSIQEISSYMEMRGGSGCANGSNVTTNGAPTVGAGNDYTIPTNTPFLLTAMTSTDPNGDALTYCWEQFDLGSVVAGEPTGSEANGPLFRSQLPVASPKRYFPSLPSVVAGATSWESLPLVSRNMTFIVTVRDFGAAGYGCTVQDQMDITVVNTGSQYAVQSPNGGEIWQSGGSETVSWNVAGTDVGAINCANVDIVLSSDGGLTFTEVLATVPNTGSAALTAPARTEPSARIMVRCSDNIFFDISDANFSIEQTDYTYQAINSSNSLCNGGAEGDFSFQLESLQGYTGTVNFSGVNLPAGASISFSPASSTLAANGMETVNFTLGNLSALATGSYTFQVETNDGVTVKSQDYTLEVQAPLSAPGLLSPVANGFLPRDAAAFDWEDVPNATSYIFKLAANANGTGGFNPITRTSSDINFGNNIMNSFVDGDMSFWSVTAVNDDCDPAEMISTPFQKFTWGMQPVTGASLAASGSPVQVCGGLMTSDNYTVSFFDADLTGPVTLATTSSPAGLNVTIAPTTLSNGESATVSFTGEENLAPGSYTITITADDGANTENIDLILDITSDPFVSPDDGTEIMISPNNQCAPNDGAVFVSFEFTAFPAGQTVTEYNFFAFRNGNGAFTIRTETPNQVFTPGYCINDEDEISYYVEATLADGSTVRSCERTFTARLVLPVTWLDFTARPSGKTSLLNWSVEQDALNAGFAIERNAPGTNNWQQMGYAQRSGADGTANYQFTDEQVAAGNTYNYRLRQEDLDGASAYSEIRTVTFDDALGLTAVPNPANDFVALNTSSGEQENLRYTLFDPAGRKVSEGTMNGGQVRINVSLLPAAIYQVLVTDGAGYREVVRIVKR